MKHFLLHALLASIVDFCVEKACLATALMAIGSFWQEDKHGSAVSGRGPLLSQAGGQRVACEEGKMEHLLIHKSVCSL